ncbi:Flagellar hook-associated protein 3 [Posidoniimonas polymericola]|uniref:Flagellar hook-associated protein 3 n=1 Tax=Posidoniimonas polymericola TaxID=2528002 RepID=A0A5C5YCU5_9BACT|nr:flagellar hook-associated protein FlgL [Posidoniimonas polymericola]TWT73537.1 Flagellar hook-associated protein 3 [Posidoniimonas polymericola]
MAAILPIPTTRTSDYLSRTRLVQQIQSDQVDLLRLQNQLSTGRRIFLPSDDPGAAVRAITLQRTIERKDQLQINISSASAKLTVAEGSLNQVSEVINSVRGSTLPVIDTVATDNERKAVIQEINQAIESLTHFANSQYQDTFLFGGTRALEEPFNFAGNFIEYRGNEANLQSHVEIGRLFDTNVSGAEIFGGMSDAVRGSVDLDLQVSEKTYLSQLNGGAGVAPNGAVQLSIGLNSYVVDLSAAHTLGDVARMIEEGAPSGSGITVDVEGDGLRVNPGPGGLAIVEVSGGRTAQELGIRQDAQVLTPFGDDVNPSLRKTSQLSDLGGTKATGRINLGVTNAGIKLRATSNGAEFDGVDVIVAGGAPSGGETAVYSAGPPPELTVTVETGVTRAQDVVDLINSDASVPFEAAVDYFGATSSQQAGLGFVVPQTFVDATSGGSGSSLDLAAGLRLTNGLGEVVIDTSAAETIEDLVNILNQPEYGLSAQINADADGIDVRSRRSGADFTIGENGGTLAEDLGIRTYTYTSRLDEFNRGRGAVIEGVNDAATRNANNLTISVTDQGVETTFEIDPIGIATVQDLIDRINGPVVDGGAGGAVVASLATVGNGLVLSRADPATTASGGLAFAADTLTFSADAPGAAGNANFTVDVVDTGSGGLSTTYNSGTGAITVDLGGSTTETTATIAADISTAVAGYTVAAADGTQPAATLAATGVAVTGGSDIGFLDPAAPATVDVAYAADTLTFAADASGSAGNDNFQFEVIDSGSGGLSTVYDSNVDPKTIVVDLGGSATETTATIAADISASVPGFTVTAADGTQPAAAVAATPVAVTGGYDADEFTVSGELADRLGFLPDGQSSVTSAGASVQAEDRNTQEVASVFNTLLRLREALKDNDTIAIGEEYAELDEDLNRATFARSEVGARLQNLDVLKIRLEDEEVQLRSTLSEAIDADIAEVISDFTARQFSLQASLQTTANLLQLSVLNFL